MRIKSDTFIKSTFFIAHFFILAFSVMGHIPRLSGYLQQLSNMSVLILILLSIAQNRYMSKNTLVAMCFAIVYSLQMYYKTGFSGFFKLLMLIVASRSIDFKSMLKCDIVYRVSMMGAVFVLCFLGVAPNNSAYYPDGTVRYTWGFQNSNQLGLLLFIIVVELLYIWDMHLTVCRSVGIFCIFVFSEIFSKSRTAELAGIIAFFCALTYTFKPRIWENMFVRKLVTYNVWIMAALTAFSQIQFMKGKMWAQRMDAVLSARLSYIEYFCENFDINLFGNDIASANRTLDSFYAYLLIGLGIVGFLFVCYMVTAVIKVAYRKKAFPFAIIMFCFTIYGLSEKLWMSVDYNLLLLGFRELVFHNVFLSNEMENNSKRLT